jgi:DNA-binding MarR family transcriptional regulator
VNGWLDEDEMGAWRGMIDAYADVHAAIEADLVAQHGMTEGEYGVLVFLSEADDHQLRMCDLATSLHLSPSGLTRRLDRLVREGMVARQPAADDRRVSMAVLTDKGFARLEEAAPDHVRSVRTHMLDHLSRTQLRQLASIMATLRRQSSATT